jgi:hypothetical protein
MPLTCCQDTVGDDHFALFVFAALQEQQFFTQNAITCQAAPPSCYKGMRGSSTWLERDSGRYPDADFWRIIGSGHQQFHMSENDN